MKNDAVKVEPLKLLLIGDSTVGKTCFYLRYTTGLFTTEHVTTVGVDYFPSTVILPDQRSVDIRLWDTAGQDRFRTITKNYIRGSHGILLLYDITCKDSFDNVAKWIGQVKEAMATIPILLIGNKCDLESKRQVPIELGKELAETHNCLFVEASAKENTNVSEGMLMVSEKAYNKLASERQNENSKGKKLRMRHSKAKCCK